MMNPVDLIIRAEAPPDFDGIREVNRLAFTGEAEARLVDALRLGGHDRLSLVAECECQIVGHVFFSDLSILTASGTVLALSLAPLAVVPSHQNRGIGSSLVSEGLRISRNAGHRIIIVLGHPGFYSRFGFSAKMADRLRSPFSGPAFMALELVPRALDGVEGDIRYPPPFDGL